MQSTYADKLKYLRGKRPRREIAEAIGTTAQAISNYEHGIRVPTDSMKRKLADHYGVTVQYLFYE